jgi:hypothetical protein
MKEQRGDPLGPRLHRAQRRSTRNTDNTTGAGRLEAEMEDHQVDRRELRWVERSFEQSEGVDREQSCGFQSGQ